MSSTTETNFQVLAPTDAISLIQGFGLNPVDFMADSSVKHLALRASGDAVRDGEELRTEVDRHLGAEGTLVLLLDPNFGEAQLAAWRNALWPLCHMSAVLVGREGEEVTRRTLHGKEKLGVKSEIACQALVGQRTGFVLAPKKTIEKFDGTAAGWNGTAGTPGYPHHRWMRKFVAGFADAKGKKRILDFGCGAGWVGIEAAVASGGAELCAFDPSPAMVDFTEKNAREAGIANFTGRTGFGEDPPFPAEGEAPFDLVFSSGVISFARDSKAWFEGLARCVAPGGTLVIGDIHPGSRGMKKRRANKAVLPIREMNAFTRDDARRELEARGFTHEASCGYQLTTPIPQAMHFNETRLGGLLTYPILFMNQAGAGLDRALGSPLQDQFDSWVMRFVFR